MNQYLVKIILLATLTIACDEKNISSDGLVGVWQLSETLADPGDGSGTFKPVDSNLKIQFFSDGNLWVDQGLFCTVTLILYDKFNGEYDTTRNVLAPYDCKFGEDQAEYTYELNEQNELIVYLPCIEPCANKFVKINEADK